MPNQREFLVRDHLLMGFGIFVAALTIVQSTGAQVNLVTNIEVQRRTDGVEVRLETSETELPDVSPDLTKLLNTIWIDI